MSVSRQRRARAGLLASLWCSVERCWHAPSAACACDRAPALPYGAPLLGYPQQQLGYPAAGAGPAPPRPASAYGQAYSQAHYAAGQAHRAAGQYQAHQYQGPPRPAAAAAAGHPHAAYNGALGQPAAQLGARAAPAAPAPAASGAPAPGALKRKLEDAEAWPAAAPAKHSTHTGAIPQQVRAGAGLYCGAWLRAVCFSGCGCTPGRASRLCTAAQPVHRQVAMRAV